MAGRKGSRVARVGQSLQRCRVHADLVQPAFDVFRKTGVLPEDGRVAEAVVDRVLGRDSVAEFHGPPSNRLAELIVGPDWAKDDAPAVGRVRECLLREALRGEGPQRLAARAVLRMAIGSGLDITDERFLADQELPEHNSVGLHLLGFPGFLAIPPYEAQAHRLFARFDELRSRIDHRNPRWFAPVAAAIRAFAATGDLPGPGLVRDAVLADAELRALILHRSGIDVAARMAALDAMAMADGEEREAAITETQRLFASRSGERELLGRGATTAEERRNQ